MGFKQNSGGNQVPPVYATFNRVATADFRVADFRVAGDAGAGDAVSQSTLDMIEALCKADPAKMTNSGEKIKQPLTERLVSRAFMDPEKGKFYSEFSHGTPGSIAQIVPCGPDAGRTANLLAAKAVRGSLTAVDVEHYVRDGVNASDVRLLLNDPSGKHEPILLNACLINGGKVDLVVLNMIETLCLRSSKELADTLICMDHDPNGLPYRLSTGKKTRRDTIVSCQNKDGMLTYARTAAQAVATTHFASKLVAYALRMIDRLQCVISGSAVKISPEESLRQYALDKTAELSRGVKYNVMVQNALSESDRLIKKWSDNGIGRCFSPPPKNQLTPIN